MAASSSAAPANAATIVALNRRRDIAAPMRSSRVITSKIGTDGSTAATAAGATARITVEHLMKPGLTPDENPQHFVVIQVDGDRLSLQVIGTGATEYRPYGGVRSTIELTDRRS